MIAGLNLIRWPSLFERLTRFEGIATRKPRRCRGCAFLEALNA